VPLTVPDTHTALSIVAGTAMAALVPYTLAKFFAPTYGVDLFELPYAAPGLEVTILWSRQFGDEEPVRWLRSLFPTGPTTPER
jgi:DNA-binding transcriptional LysR family regulator